MLFQCAFGVKKKGFTTVVYHFKNVYCLLADCRFFVCFRLQCPKEIFFSSTSFFFFLINFIFLVSSYIFRQTFIANTFRCTHKYTNTPTHPYTISCYYYFLSVFLFLVDVDWWLLMLPRCLICFFLLLCLLLYLPFAVVVVLGFFKIFFLLF